LPLTGDAATLCRELRSRLGRISFEEQRYLVERLVKRVVLDGRDIAVEVIVPLASEVAPSDVRLDARANGAWSY